MLKLHYYCFEKYLQKRCHHLSPSRFQIGHQLHQSWFCQETQTPPTLPPKPVIAQNADGSDNEAGLIKFITTLFIRIQGIIHRVLFHIIDCGNKNIILGDPWLQKINPLIDWEKRTLEILDHTDRTYELNHQNIKVQGISINKPM